MLIEKQLQTSILLSTPDEYYSPDINAVLMDKIKQRFEGVCQKSILILKVVEIIEKAYTVFSKRRQDGSAMCDVRFLVQGIVLAQGNIVHNAIVKNIDKKGNIIARNKYVAVYLKKSMSLQTIRKGQIMPVRIGLIKYTIGQTQMSINAFPFIPRYRKAVIYKTNNYQNSGIIKILMKELTDEMKRHEGLDTDVYEFFIKLMNPYKSKKHMTKYLKDTKGTITNVDMVPSTDMLISLPDALHSAPGMLKYVKHQKIKTDNPLDYEDLDETPKDKGGHLVIAESYEVVVGTHLKNHINYANDIRQLCTTYSSMAEVRSNNNLWNIYTKNKRE